MSKGDSVTEVVRRIEGGADDLAARLRRMARLALPVDARVVVVTEAPAELFDLNVPLALPFPWDCGLSMQAPDEELIRNLERLRLGMQFLLVPNTERPWFDRKKTFKQHVEAHYRVVVDEAETAIVFALRDPADMPADRMGPDGLPVPPPEMVHLVVGMFDFETLYEPFLQAGEASAASIRAVLKRNGLAMDDFGSILDFGCGSGRVIRQWKALSGSNLHGSDYNPYMIEWCNANLRFADFTLNGVAPPLDYGDEEFDFVYALSVFTHFLEAVQVPWAQELARVLRPGGFALITLHGVSRKHQVPEPEWTRFEAGELVVLYDDRAGTNDVAVFHPKRYVYEVLAPQAGLEVVAFVPDGQADMGQDAVLLRRI